MNNQQVMKEARAKRLKALRKMSLLSGKRFSERYGIPRGTLQNWETYRFGGLSEKGARAVLKAFKAEGIICTFEWLMHGIGPGPRIQNSVLIGDGTDEIGQSGTEVDQSEFDEQQARAISKELLLFREHQSDPVDFVVHDDAMAPCFQEGDYVAGCRRHRENIETAVGQDCIVQTVAGDILLRRLRKGSIPDRYTLVPINPETKVQAPYIYDAELYFAAPVIWIRRPDQRALNNR